MGFVSERFFLYADIDACENFPYVNAFETARKRRKKNFGWCKRLETILINFFMFL